MRKKILASLLATLAISCLAGGAIALTDVQPVSASTSVATPNDTSVINTETPASEAVVITYDGTPTIRYGAQGYAGVSGPAWTVGGYSAWTDCGSGSHPFGSNHGDGRTGLTVTFKVDSTVAENAYLLLYIEGNDYSVGTLAVNGGEPVSYNLKQMKKFHSWDAHDVSFLPVSFVKGVNEIVLTMGEDYTVWFHGFAFSPVQGGMKAATEGTAYYPVTMNTSIGGQWTNLDQHAFGNNAMDDPANYGKSGSITYNVYAPMDGIYNIGMQAMSGNGLSNRVKITVNGNVCTFNGNEYYSFDTSAGWSYIWNYAAVELKKGDNTVTFENSLVCVNQAKNTEVPAGTAGCIYISNWYINQLSLSFVAPTIDMEMAFGAATYLREPYGLRWRITADKADVETLIAYFAEKNVTYEFGAIVTTYEEGREVVLNASYKTHEVASTKGFYEAADGSYGYNVGLVSIQDGNIQRQFIARGYLKFTLNGTDYVYYADYNQGDVANNARSLYFVANAALEKGGYSEAQTAVLQGIINKVQA